MNRRAFVSGLGTLTAAPSFACAQPVSRLYRTGYLGTAQTDTNPLPNILLGRLGELGYTEGRNLVVERRFSEGRNERYRALAIELASLKLDLIVAPGTAAALAAKEATTTIPIVMVVVGDPVGSRLIASLARPGGNVTGMSSSVPDIIAKGLELLKEGAPRLSRVAVLRDASIPVYVRAFKELEVAARTLRVRLQPIDVRSYQDIEGAFAAMTRERADALILMDDPFIALGRRRIADLALHRRLPTVSSVTRQIPREERRREAVQVRERALCCLRSPPLADEEAGDPATEHAPAPYRPRLVTARNRDGGAVSGLNLREAHVQ